MKKILSLIMVFAVSIVMVSCKTAEDKQNEVVDIKPLVTVVTDQGGLGDHSFNDKALEALEDVQKDEDIDIRFLEASSSADYEKVLIESANEGAVLTVAVGSNLEDAVIKVAAEKTDSYFAIIDSQKQSKNIKSMSFADNESGFLAGYAAAKTSKTGKIGIIGGDERSTVSLFSCGYEAGAKSANPNIQIVKGYVGSFYDSDKGYKTAEKMFKDNNTDVIMHVAGPSGTGIIKAAKDNGFWVIGADKDQSSLASDNVLCSAVKEMKDGLADMIKEAIKGNFEGNHMLYNLKDGGVDISDNAGNLSAELKNELKTLKKAIKSGDLSVPKDEAELQTFVFPEKLKSEASEK